MFAQMQDEIAARNLAIKRRVLVVAIIPVDGESKEPLGELIPKAVSSHDP